MFKTKIIEKFYCQHFASKIKFFTIDDDVSILFQNFFFYYLIPHIDQIFITHIQIATNLNKKYIWILTLWLQWTRYLVLPRLYVLPKTRYLVSINSFVCLLRKNYIYVSYLPRNKFLFGVSIESGLFLLLYDIRKDQRLYFFLLNFYSKNEISKNYCTKFIFQ